MTRDEVIKCLNLQHKRTDNPFWIVNQSQYDLLKQHPAFVEGNPPTIGGTPLYIAK